MLSLDNLVTYSLERDVDLHPNSSIYKILRIRLEVMPNRENRFPTVFTV